MSDELGGIIRIANLMRDLKQHEGWQFLVSVMERSIEAEKDYMASGIENRDEYWIGVGKIAGIRSILRKPDQLIREGEEAVQLLMEQQREGES